MVFKYLDNRKIETIISKELFNELLFIGNSQIDNTPIYEFKNINNIKLENIINTEDINSLKTIIRKYKIIKLLKKEVKLDYEFLDFWSKNMKNLILLKPI
jgi:hypothetical protein